MGSKEQIKLMQDFYEMTGFEFMGKDDVRGNNPSGFISQWHKNCEWLRDVVTNVERHIDSYSMKY